MVLLGSVPINDHTIDAAADHVFNLSLYLCRIVRVVSHIHVASLAEPEQVMRENLSRISRIKKGMNVDLAHITCAQVAVGLAGEIVRRAGVVRGLRGKRRGWRQRWVPRWRSRTWTRCRTRTRRWIRI